MGVASYVNDDVLGHILFSLTELNRLACIVSLTTGLRIDDVLSLRREQVEKGRFTVKEKKTGKSRRISIGENLREQLLSVSGKNYIFEHRYDPTRHRTRQAVYNDLQRVSRFYRLPTALQVSPHTMRKVYAVRTYRRTCSVSQVQRLLSHDSEAVTMLYAMADLLTAQRVKGNKKAVQCCTDT